MKFIKSSLSIAFLFGALFFNAPIQAQTADQGKVAGATTAKVSVTGTTATDSAATKAIDPADREGSTASNGTMDNNAPGSRGQVEKTDNDRKGGGSTAEDSTSADATNFDNSGKYWLIGIAIILTIIIALSTFGRIKKDDSAADTMSH